MVHKSVYMFLLEVKQDEVNKKGGQIVRSLLSF